MRPYFVVRNSRNSGHSGGQNREDCRATATFEALPGQERKEGVVIAFPAKRCGAAKDALHVVNEGVTSIDESTEMGESRDEIETVIPAAVVPIMPKVQLRSNEGSLCLSFSLNDGTDLSIFNSTGAGSSDEYKIITEGDGTQPTKVFRFARAAYPHLLLFCHLTSQETNVPSQNHDDIIYGDSNPSASQYIPIDAQCIETLNSLTVETSIALSTEPVRNAHIYDDISFADLHNMVRTVQNQIPMAIPTHGRLDLNQFLAFSCLLEQRVAHERDAAPRLSVRVLDRFDSSIRIVVSSSNKACRITANARPTAANDTNESIPQIQTSVRIAKAKEGMVELNGLDENTEYKIEINGCCPLSRNSSKRRIVVKTKLSSCVEPELYPLWDDMSRNDQETELLAVIKDRATRNLAAMEGISTDSIDLTPNKDILEDTKGHFALWWSKNDRVRKDFCLREAQHASKDPTIRESAKREGVIIKSRDWQTTATDPPALRRRKRFSWWYYEIDTKNRVGVAGHPGRDGNEREEDSSAPCEVAISQASLNFRPSQLPSQHAADQVLPKSAQHTLSKGAEMYDRKPKADQGMASTANYFVITNRSENADALGQVYELECRSPGIPDVPKNNSKHSEEGPILTASKQGQAPETPTVSPESANDSNISNLNAQGVDASSNNTKIIIQVKESDQIRPTASTKEANIMNAEPKSTSDPMYPSAASDQQKPSQRSKRSTFLGAKTANTEKAVDEVDKMLAFQKRVKQLRGVALLKAKVRLVMISARLQALRKKSGCKDDASALDHVDLFDDKDEGDDTEQSFHDVKIKSETRPQVAIATCRPPVSAVIDSHEMPPDEENSDAKFTNSHSLALAKFEDIYQHNATRGKRRAIQSWRFHVDQEKISESQLFECDRSIASITSADTSLTDENTTMSPTVSPKREEEDVIDKVDESTLNLDERQSKTLDEDDTITSSMEPSASINSPLELVSNISPAASEPEEVAVPKEQNICPFHRYRMHDDERVDEDYVCSSSKYLAQTAKIMEFLSARDFCGSGASISKPEYETEFRGFIEHRTPLPNIRGRFAKTFE